MRTKTKNILIGIVVISIFLNSSGAIVNAATNDYDENSSVPIPPRTIYVGYIFIGGSPSDPNCYIALINIPPLTVSDSGETISFKANYSMTCTGSADDGYVDISFPDTGESQSAHTGTTLSGTLTLNRLMTPGISVTIKLHLKWTDWYGAVTIADYSDYNYAKTIPGDPLNLNAYNPTRTTIDLSWTNGAGADKTRIQRKTGSYPTSLTDGTQVFFDTGNSFTDTGLSFQTTYYYRAWAYDSESSLYSTGYSSDSETTLPNHGPNTPSTPSGTSSGYTGVSYSYSTSTTDPDGDQVKYGWDWNGDGTVDEWTAFYNSGVTISASHSWSSAGTYYVKVKAKDIYDAESGWSPTKTVTIVSTGTDHEIILDPNYPSWEIHSNSSSGTSYSDHYAHSTLNYGDSFVSVDTGLSGDEHATSCFFHSFHWTAPCDVSNARVTFVYRLDCVVFDLDTNGLLGGWATTQADYYFFVDNSVNHQPLFSIECQDGQDLHYQYDDHIVSCTTDGLTLYKGQSYILGVKFQIYTHSTSFASAYVLAYSNWNSNDYTDMTGISVLWENRAPNKPSQPSGPTSGKINTDYTYNTSTADLDVDAVYYQWDWGDGVYSDWYGPYASDEIASATHRWASENYYNIKVRAKDSYESTSEWSDPLNVHMPCSYTCFLAGTQVTMADRTYKNIEDVKIGDLVKSFDDVNKKEIIGVVTKTLCHAPEDMTDYYVVVNNKLQVTPNHCIYVDGSWVPAGDLAVGDRVSTSKTAIRSIEKVYTQVQTYDLVVQPVGMQPVVMGGIIHNTQLNSIQSQPFPYFADGVLTRKIPVNTNSNFEVTPQTPH